MSWSFSFSVEHIGNFEATAKAALEKNRANILQYNPDGIEAAEAAVEAVISLVDKGIVGDGAITASLSGHGNPNHVAPSQFSKDTVNISLQRTDA